MSDGRHLVIALAAALLSSAACGAHGPAGVVIERQTLQLNLLVDGSVEVREALTVRFTQPVTSFERRVPRERADALFDVQVSMDGQRVDAGTAPVGARVDADGELSVLWTFPQSSVGTHEFVLDYRASNAVSVHGANGLFYWRVLPIVPAAPIGRSDVTLTVPAGATFMAPPTIDAAPVWTMDPSGAGLTAFRTGIGPDETAMVWARLASDTLALAEPAWQYEAARADELRLAWISAGLFMMVIGLGAIAMVAIQYPNHRRRARRAGTPADVPALAPAIAEALRSRRRGGATREIAAALRGLESRGAITFARGSKGEQATPARERIVLVDAPADLLEHERVLVDELWLGKDDTGTDAADLLRPPRRLRRRFAASLTRDLVTAGYAAQERVTVAEGLRFAALAIMVLALLCAGAVPVFLARFGVWPYAVPVGIFILGLMLVPYAATFSILTETGERTALALGRR